MEPCLVDVPLMIFSCPAHDVPNSKPRIFLGTVEAELVNVKDTHKDTHCGRRRRV